MTDNTLYETINMTSSTPIFLPGQTITLTVKPNAKQNSVTRTSDTLLVHTTAPAIDGKANTAVLKLLKKYLGIKAELISGYKSSIKKVRIIGVKDLNTA